MRRLEALTRADFRRLVVPGCRLSRRVGGGSTDPGGLSFLVAVAVPAGQPDGGLQAGDGGGDLPGPGAVLGEPYRSRRPLCASRPATAKMRKRSR